MCLLQTRNDTVRNDRGELMDKKCSEGMKKRRLREACPFVRSGNRQKGVSMIEIATVLVLVSILAIFVAPDLEGWNDKMNLKDTLDTVIADMQRAKMHAVKDNVDVQFEWVTGTGTLAGNDCKNWGYRVKEVVSGTVITDDPVVLADQICITANTFAANEGFTSRGLPLVAGGGMITIQHGDLPTFQGDISQSVAGAIRMDILKGGNPSNL